MKKISEFLRSPARRHGRLATLWMAIGLCTLVLFNLAFTVLEDHFGWRRDFSFNQYATTGEETAKVLESLELPVDLYLLYQNGEEDTQLLQLLNRYRTQCAFIKVHETDIARDPGILNRFRSGTEGTPQADSVIVHCPDTGKFRILNYADFITQSYSVEDGTFSLTGLAYEKKLTEAILYASRAQSPVIGMVQGHGEFTQEEMSLFWDFLSGNGYTLRQVSLTEDLSDCSLLMLAAPQKDLREEELTALSDFAKAGGSFIITRDYTDPMDTMPNYMAFLRSYGVKPLSGIVVAAQDAVSDYYGERIAILPYLAKWDMTYSLTSSGMDILLMPAASAFVIPEENTSTLSCGALLSSGQNTWLRNYADGVDSVEKQPGDPEGPLTLAAYAQRSHSQGEISRLLALGSTSMLTYEYIYQRTYTEEFILTLLKEMIPSDTVSREISVSAAVRPGLRVGTETAGRIILIALPLCILLAAVLILLPRSRR